MHVRDLDFDKYLFRNSYIFWANFNMHQFFLVHVLFISILTTITREFLNIISSKEKKKIIFKYYLCFDLKKQFNLVFLN